MSCRDLLLVSSIWSINCHFCYLSFGFNHLEDYKSPILSCLPSVSPLPKSPEYSNKIFPLKCKYLVIKKSIRDCTVFTTKPTLLNMHYKELVSTCFSNIISHHLPSITPTSLVSLQFLYLEGFLLHTSVHVIVSYSWKISLELFFFP